MQCSSAGLISSYLHICSWTKILMYDVLSTNVAAQCEQNTGKYFILPLMKVLRGYPKRPFASVII